MPIAVAELPEACTIEQPQGVLHDKPEACTTRQESNGVVHNRISESNAASQGRKGGLKSAQTRRQQIDRLAKLESLLPEVIPALSQALSSPIPNPDNAHAISTCLSQIAKLDKFMASRKRLTPKEWQACATAKYKLTEVWAWLAGIPKPMDRPRPQQRIRQAIAEPIPIPSESK